jgi:tRNA G26 N,N-dimethylase Trm1
VATNKADPHCTDCQKGDAVSGPLYYGKPDMPLDEKTLAEVTDSIDGTSSILEDGLAILEKHVKDPDKAVAELGAYRQKNVAAIKRTFDKALEIKARLKGSGYDQDIPAEVRPHFDERMGKIHARLELMRDTYRKHPAVLEGFGAFFPRGP